MDVCVFRLLQYIEWMCAYSDCFNTSNGCVRIQTASIHRMDVCVFRLLQYIEWMCAYSDCFNTSNGCVRIQTASIHRMDVCVFRLLQYIEWMCAYSDCFNINTNIRHLKIILSDDSNLPSYKLMLQLVEMTYIKPGIQRPHSGTKETGFTLYCLEN